MILSDSFFLQKSFLLHQTKILLFENRNNFVGKARLKPTCV